MRIRRVIIWGKGLSPLLFVLALILISLVLREVKATYQSGDLYRKVNHLFMDDPNFGQERLVNTAQIFSEDIRMEFGICKCVALVRKEVLKSEGIQQPKDEVIKNIENRD